MNVADAASSRYLHSRLRVLPEYEQRRLLRVALELRANRLPYSSIATVLTLYEAVDLTENMVRYWLRANGSPPDPVKSQNARAQIAAGVGRWAR